MVYHKAVYRLKPCILAEFQGQKTPTLRLKRQTSVRALLLAPLKKLSLFFEVGSIFLLSSFAKFGLFETFIPAGTNACKKQPME